MKRWEGDMISLFFKRGIISWGVLSSYARDLLELGMPMNWSVDSFWFLIREWFYDFPVDVFDFFKSLPVHVFFIWEFLNALIDAVLKVGKALIWFFWEFSGSVLLSLVDSFSFRRFKSWCLVGFTKVVWLFVAGCLVGTHFLYFNINVNKLWIHNPNNNAIYFIYVLYILILRSSNKINFKRYFYS